MHHHLYTISLGLTNTPTLFGARRRHLQGVPFQLLVSQRVRWYPATVRTCVAEMQPSFAIRHFCSIVTLREHYVDTSYIKHTILEQHLFGQLFETVWRVEKLTGEMALPGHGVDEGRNA